MTYRCMSIGCSHWVFGKGCGNADAPEHSSDWIRHTVQCPLYEAYSAANLYMQDHAQKDRKAEGCLAREPDGSCVAVNPCKEGRSLGRCPWGPKPVPKAEPVVEEPKPVEIRKEQLCLF